MEKLDFIILAGGKGVRMCSDIPKPLHIIDGKTMIERVVDTAKKMKPDRIIAVVRDERVRDKAVKIGLNTAWQEQALGTADALKAALPQCSEDNDLMITCVDIPFITHSIFKGLYCAHVAEKNHITVLTSIMDDPTGYGRVVKDGSKIIGIVEEKEATDQQKKIALINAGIYCIIKKNIDNYLEKIGKSPVKGEYYLTDIVGVFADEGKKIGEFECGSRFIMGINTKEQLKKISEVWRKKCTAN
ncbi:NTP transferase domain-containing protein [Elusimicrobiota bacterium]